MSIKKYLTTPEEILALKDTDTKIYIKGLSTYYQYVDGVLCRFHEKYPAVFNCAVELNGLDPLYILVEEPISNATEKDIGKLCWFWDDDENDDIGTFGMLKYIIDGQFYLNEIIKYSNCRKLTPTELAEITGYKVEE